MQNTDHIDICSANERQKLKNGVLFDKTGSLNSVPRSKRDYSVLNKQDLGLYFNWVKRYQVTERKISLSHLWIALVPC